MYGQMTLEVDIHRYTRYSSGHMKLSLRARRHFDGSLKNTLTVTAGLGGMGGAQPLAVTMNEGVNISIEICKNRIQKRLDTNI